MVSLRDSVNGRAAMLAVASLIICAMLYAHLWMPAASSAFFRLQPPHNMTVKAAKDELEIALESASMANKTVIISVLNKAYAKENGMLDLFLRSVKEGEDTEALMKHLLLVAVDEAAHKRCRTLGLHCFRLVTEGVDFSKEEVFMTRDFIKMMWRRTLFLGDVLRRGYNFIFTDMDVIWLRNPFGKLGDEGDDMQISCDWFNGEPWDHANAINTGFYFVVSNNKTISLFDEWYRSRNEKASEKEQDVLSNMKNNGVFEKLRIKVRFLDTIYFSGFCKDSSDFRQVTTVHANCCRSVNAKLADLAACLEVWKKFNGTATARWPPHKACQNSWKE